MDKRAKTALIIGVSAVALYLLYRWYKNRQASPSASGGGITSGLGTNLNSVNPISEASVSDSGLNYQGGPVDITVESTVPAQPTTPSDSDTTPRVISGRLNPSPEQGTLPHPVSTNAATSRTTPRALNASPHTTSNAVKRTPPVNNQKAKRRVKVPTRKGA